MGFSSEVQPAMPEITPADAGTWLDGSQGWHNTYRVIERAQAYGFVLPNGADDEDLIAHYKADDGTLGPDESDLVMEISNEASDYLESRAPEGFTFIWDAGELTLMSVDQATDDGWIG